MLGVRKTQDRSCRAKSSRRADSSPRATAAINSSSSIALAISTISHDSPPPWSPSIVAHTLSIAPAAAEVHDAQTNGHHHRQSAAAGRDEEAHHIAVGGAERSRRLVRRREPPVSHRGPGDGDPLGRQRLVRVPEPRTLPRHPGHADRARCRRLRNGWAHHPQGRALAAWRYEGPRSGVGTCRALGRDDQGVDGTSSRIVVPGPSVAATVTDPPWRSAT